MIDSYGRGLRKCSRPAPRKKAPSTIRERLGILRPYPVLSPGWHVQARVAVDRAPRVPLRASALRVEVGELARRTGQPAPVLVDHPRVEHDAAAGALAQAEHARLLREVGQRTGGDEPEAARTVRLDRVAVAVAGDRRNDGPGGAHRLQR